MSDREQGAQIVYGASGIDGIESETSAQGSALQGTPTKVIEMDDYCVARELVLRSLDDSDFSVKPV